MSIKKLTNRVFDASNLSDTQIANILSVNHAKKITNQNICDYRAGRQNMRFDRLIEVAFLLDVEICFEVLKIKTIL